jgi:spermidine synthase
VITRELLGTAQVPGGEELRLFRHGDDFMIVLDRNELMNTRMSGSEEALAVMSIARLREADDSAARHVLIGGYGMGFTLRAALGVLDANARVTVAELVPEIIAWARGPMAALTAGCLEDRRVVLLDDDVSWLIGGAEAEYDAILLDVDNGPDGLVRQDNGRLYTMRGLRSALAALRPGGVLAVWSAGPDAAFTRRLADVGFHVEQVRVRARSNGKGAQHVIWFATKPEL